MTLAACGGHTASRHDVVTRADAICANTLSQIRAVPPPAGTSAGALAAYLRRAQPIVEAESRAIAKLPRPSAQRATLDGFVSQVGAVARAFAAARRAAVTGDATGARSALAMLETNRAAVLAAHYGMRQCTGTVATLGR